MEKCRICLGNKKNLRSIYDTQDEYTFAFMITSIANVKIVKEDGVTDKICLGCRRKLKEAYDFKVQIERSDSALQKSPCWKKIHFDNLNDIKIKIEVDIPKPENNIDDYFKDGETTIFYNNTVIKKVEPCDTDVNIENGPLSVLDFLNTIKDDSENDFNDEYDVDYEPISDAADDEYLIPLKKRLKLKKSKKKKKYNKTERISKERGVPNYKPVHIKPIYLNDIKVLPTKSLKPRIKKKYIYKKKSDMCNICGKIVQNIKSHLLTHSGDRPFKCEKCGKGYYDSKTLSYHEKKVHVAERNFKCDLCVASFTNKQSLKSHMHRHSEDRQYVCDLCKKGFKRRQALARHKLIHNIANKRIKCDLCNMTFITKYGLNHHLRIHTGERPYNCELCSQPYSYKHDFNRHCFKKHGIFLKRRPIKVMNEEVLKKERELMRNLMLKIHGYDAGGEYGNGGELLTAFEGPQGYMAFEQAVRVLQEKQIPTDLNI